MHRPDRYSEKYQTIKSMENSPPWICHRLREGFQQFRQALFLENYATLRNAQENCLYTWRHKLQSRPKTQRPLIRRPWCQNWNEPELLDILFIFILRRLTAERNYGRKEKWKTMDSVTTKQCPRFLTWPSHSTDKCNGKKKRTNEHTKLSNSIILKTIHEN